MRKKIAVFTAVWNADYLYPFLQGLKQGALERNADLYIFNSYGDSEREYEAFTSGEYNIFLLPELSQFDGILIAANNVGVEPWLARLREEISRLGIPCVGVEQPDGMEYSIGVDNYRAMRAVVEHLVVNRKCRVLNYVGGPRDNGENILRKSAFLDVLKQYDLLCDPRRVRDYSFLTTDGIQAYQDFKELGLERPDAVVCANDNMAIGYLSGAEADGLSAPVDFLITGFDNTKQAQQYFPRVTSVDRGRKELGRSSLLFIDDLIEKRECPRQWYVPFHLALGESSGDRAENDWDGTFRRELYNINTRNDQTRRHLKHMRTALLGRKSPEEFAEIVSRFAPLLGMDRFVMVVESKKIVENSPIDRLFFGSYDGEAIRIETSGASGIIPQQWLREDGECHSYLFSPCHCNGKKFGYYVTIDNLEVIRENLLSEWMLAVDNAMENLRQNLNLQIMNRKLNELYRRDSMTGLYNRFALKEMGEELLRRNREQRRSTLVIFVDMDCLKKANDVFGHDIGDLALKTIADAMRQVCDGRMELAIRYGGDEFLLLGSYPGEAETKQIMMDVEQTISALGAQRKLPFPLSASTGCARIDADAPENLEYHIRQADQRMYQRKMEKRKTRENASS